MSTQSDSRGTTDAAHIYTDGTYFHDNPSWHAEDSPWKAGQIRKILAKNGINPNSVCEVGCGAGEILRQLSIVMPTCSFTGYELSPQAFALCTKRASERLVYFNDDILKNNVFFEVVLCIDVFEHVEDYFGFLRGLKSTATYKVFHIPLDISVLSVVGRKFMSERKSVGHLHYFTKETALATLKDCRYEIIDWFYTLGFSELPGKRILKEKIVNVHRHLLYALSPDWAVKILGGCSLMVLSK